MSPEFEKFDINKLRVASPCSVPWAKMAGDERSRNCDICRLNVYNTAEMSTREVEQLIENREGRLCIRLYRRVDGTVITKDCPVGVRAYKKRVAKMAGAALGAIIGLFSVSYSQTSHARDASKVKISRTVNSETSSKIHGTVTDPNGAVVANAVVTLFSERSEPLTGTTNDEGYYELNGLQIGKYRIEVTSPGFITYRVKNLQIAETESIGLDVELKIDGEMIMGVFVDSDELRIDMTSSTVKSTITRRTVGLQRD